MPAAYATSQCPSLRGFRLRAAFGGPVRNDDGASSATLPPFFPFFVIPDGRAALGAAEPEPTRCFEVRASQRAGIR
jgi:hypothetical protein